MKPLTALPAFDAEDTLNVVIETPRHFRRVFDRGSGVALIDLGPES